ncbi:MAG: hypothetical protein J7K22_01165 [Nanoarchaeota archaeon]|nr:hypothetical protein [Nanoarchaeota archaeon]
MDIKGFKKNTIVLIICDADKILKNTIDIIKTLQNDYLFLYVAISHPYHVLSEIFKKQEIDVNKIFFIDCVTKMTLPEKAVQTPHCLFIDTPSSLNELNIAINRTINSMPNKDKLLFMDSLTTLLVYSSSGSIAKFSHFLINKIKLMGLSGVFMSVEKEMDERLVAQLTEFCDEVIRI